MILALIILVIWSVALLMQLRYWIFPAPDRTPAQDTPRVSVVVCAHQFGQQLQRLVAHLRAQSYGPFEVVIVNDGLDAEIDGYLTSLNWDKLRVVSFDSSKKLVPGKKAPLTAGIQAAKFPWILVTDADCIPGTEWISTMVRVRTSDSALVLGFGPFLRTPGMLNLMQRFDAFLIAIQYLGAAMRGATYMGVGRNMLYHKSLFDAVAGFTQHAQLMSGDDDLFVQSAASNTQVSVSLAPESFVYSEAPDSMRAWLWQKRRHLSVSHIYSSQAKMRTVSFALSWITFWCGLPLLILLGIPWFVLCVPVVIIWAVFSVQALRLKQESLIAWFPLIAPLYCLVIVIFAVLLILKAPQHWSTS